MKSYKQNKKCTLSKYFSWYLQLNRSCDLNKCYYIEKTPIYARTPWIPIIYSNMMPKVKLITIIRNPINHIWSNVFAFTAKGRSKSNIKKGLNYIEHWIIDQIKESFSFNKLSKICKDINIKWNQLKNEDKELRHSILIKNEYKQYVVEYLKLKFVSPRDINRGTRQQMFIWAPVLLPNFLIGLLSYEYELGIYNHFKMIQFEYIYSNTADAMSQIRCWISGICGIDDQEKHYLFQTVERTNPASKNNTFSTWYQQQIHQLFDDCSQILLNILLIDRRDLLIGDWITWN